MRGNQISIELKSKIFVSSTLFVGEPWPPQKTASRAPGAHPFSYALHAAWRCLCLCCVPYSATSAVYIKAQHQEFFGGFARLPRAISLWIPESAVARKKRRGLFFQLLEIARCK